MARHSFRKSPRAHGMKLYMFVQLIANLCITDWSSGLISFCLKMHCMIYSVPDAESKCSLVNGNICGVPLSLSKSKRVLISAPDKKQHGADVSKVKVSYIPHWITYFILWSVIGLDY
ncbi:hypothetical protein CY35_17G047500 [Sphagnum magellanicum]|nr:hypothetical protein CY35_17G047500 [Sphagnum magellanicum]